MNNNLLLNTAPVAALPLQPGAAALAVGGVPTLAFANTLASQQASLASAELLAVPPIADAAAQDPSLSDTEQAAAGALLLPAGSAALLGGEAALLAQAGEVDAAPETPDEQGPAVDGQTSYALAALGLWQTVPLPAAPATGTPVGSAAVTPAPLLAPPAEMPVRPATAAQTAVPFSTETELTAEQQQAGKQLIERLSASQPTPYQAAAAPQASAADLGLALPGLALESPKAASPLLAPVADAGTLALKGEPRQWQQPLLQALGDRLQVQIAGRSEQAVIRLEPPLLGQVEIAIRQQAGELQVRMSASHGEVARQLHQISDTLRQDLVQRHSGDVTVQVTQSARSDDARQSGRDPQSQQQQQQAQDQREQQRRPGRGLGEEASTGATAGFAPSLMAADITA